MNCTNCGKELNTEEKFCDNCGTKVESPIPADQAQDNKTPVDTPVVEETSVGETTAKKSKKKNRKGLFIGLGVGIVALIVAVLVALPFLKKDEKTPVSSNDDNYVSDVDYFVALERASTDKALTQISVIVDEYGKYDISSTDKILTFLDSKKAESSFELTLSKGITDYLSETADVDLGFLKNLDFDFAVEMDGDKTGLNISLGLEGNKIITANAVLDMENSVAYLSIPELSDTAMKFDIKKLAGKDVETIVDDVKNAPQVETSLVLYSELPDGATVSSTIKEYIDIILDSIVTVEKAQTEVTVGGKTSKYSEMTAKFTPDALEALVVSLLERLKNDENVWKVIEGFGNLVAPEDPPLTRADFLENYDSIVNGINGSFDKIKEFNYSIIINENEEIMGRKFTGINGDSAYFICNENGLIFNVKHNNNDVVNVTFDGTISAESYDGLLKAELGGEEVFTVDVENSKPDGSYLNITLTPGKLLKEALAVLQEGYPIFDELGINLPESSLVITSENEKTGTAVFGNVNFDIKLISDGATAFRFESGTEYSDTKGITTPEKFENVDGIGSAVKWLSKANLFGFISNLPKSVSDIALGAFLSLL